VSAIRSRSAPDTERESDRPGADLRIALFTLESTASAAVVAAFARTQRDRLVLVGRSDPYRRAMGGALGQMARHVRRSGPRLLPWLAVEFTLPRLASALHRGGSGSLAALCAEAGVPMVTVADVNGPALHEALRAARPDLIVSFHFDQIFSGETLALAPRGGINVHPSLLPNHRGPMPAFWALLDGAPTGVTVHRLAPRIDAGAILAQRAVRVPAGASVSTAARLLHEAGAALAAEVVDHIAAGSEPGKPASEPLPYRPFPPASALSGAARRGLRLVRMADLRAALTVRM
jgi:folate-dependent phosphoribosylglycinamide formyltransferase PurN